MCSDDGGTDIQAQLDNLALLASRQASSFVFVTSTTHTGRLGGIAGADAICNNLAQAAGLPGDYAAWLATNDADDPESTDLLAPGAWILTNGDIVVDDWDDLTSYMPLNVPINVDETGAVVSTGSMEVWTNVNFDGSFSSPDRDRDSCRNWTQDTDGGDWWFEGQRGDLTTTDKLQWTALPGSGKCHEKRHLYCVGQGLVLP